MKVNTTKKYERCGADDGWCLAVQLCAAYLRSPGRADELLAAERGGLSGKERARCQSLFYAVLRNLSLLRAGVAALCPRSPEPEVLALLLVAGAELLEAADDVAHRAKVTDFAVSKVGSLLPARMKGFVNAVLRRLPAAIADAPSRCTDALERLALQHSHPLWLVRRWQRQFGHDNMLRLLEWDQRPAEVFLRLEGDVEPPPCLKPASWPGYYSYDGGGWEPVARLFKEGLAYAQDPSTRLCVELLAPRPGMQVLDLCSAPGGKARLMLPRMAGDRDGLLVCVDLPGGRCDRLRENFARLPASGVAFPSVEIVECDVLALNADGLRARNLPAQYDAILLDAPCSNSGVLRRRPDARWRLKPEDFANCAALQDRLLAHAATLLAPGGRLVYSTCSIDDEENEQVVDEFLMANPRFVQTGRVSASPWVDGHDGAGAARLERLG